MRLGFVLATRDDGDRALCVRLARAAVAAGHEVRVFLMHDGVEGDLAALAETGADVVACGTNVVARAIRLPPSVGEGSQLDHAQLVRECDRVVSFA